MFEKNVQVNAVVKNIEENGNINPSQYITRNGYPFAGSNGRFHVEFQLEDDTTLTFSISAKEAGNLSKGMKGILTYKRNTFKEFTV